MDRIDRQAFSGRLDGLKPDVLTETRVVEESGFSWRVALDQIFTVVYGVVGGERAGRKKLPEDNDWWVWDLSNIHR